MGRLTDEDARSMRQWCILHVRMLGGEKVVSVLRSMEERVYVCALIESLKEGGHVLEGSAWTCRSLNKTSATDSMFGLRNNDLLI